MKLKQDFVEAICRLYVEKHKPEHFRKLIDDEAKGNFIYSFKKLALHKRNFYQLISK
jgi:hypothetical protein